MMSFPLIWWQGQMYLLCRKERAAKRPDGQESLMFAEDAILQNAS